MQEYNVFEMITADQRPNWHLYIDAKKNEGTMCLYATNPERNRYFCREYEN